jgi:glycosyltransferase involved in cell wall biosynthesis
MCQAFAKNGHEVILIARNKKREMEAKETDIYAFYGVENCFEIIKLPWLPIKGSVFIYGFASGKKALELRPDIVYCRNIPGCYFVAKFGASVIYESHSPVKGIGMISDWLFKRILNSSNLEKLVVITFALKEYYEINYPSANGKIKVAPDAADPMPESIQPIELPNKSERLQIGYVGHLYRGKGMEIVSRLAMSCPWADFHIVGGTDKDINFWKKQCSSIKNISFQSYIPHVEVAKYIQAFDIVILPNQRKVSTDNNFGGKDIGQWTSPLKAFEYMAAGKPIIASDLSILREILEHEHNALLCLPDSVLAWQNAIERLRNDQKLRDRLGRNAYNDFMANHTWKKRAKKVICR